ncbi:unnamed protein product, partial [Ostreobium quekettii]
MDSQRSVGPRQGWKLTHSEKMGNVGQIVSVKLVNFMNHDHFEVHFGPHVNFVSGQNGSGKSAILQAVQICLAVKARDTGRGTNVSQYVKTGTSSGTVRVSLWNSPVEDAFEHDKYGDVITVERKLLRTGGGTYHMLSSKGVPIGKGAESVKDMLRHFNIDCSNPIVVMTQDFARTFLKPSGSQLERNLFKVYMKATQFEHTLENLRNARIHKENMKADSDFQGKEVEAARKEAEDLRQRVEELQQVEGIAERIEAMFNCCMHVSQKEFEKRLAELEAKCTQEIKPRLKELVRLRDEKREEIRMLKDRKGAEAKRLSALHERVSGASELKKQMKEQTKFLTNMKTRKAHAIDRLTKDIANMEEEKKGIEKQLATFHEDFAASRATAEQEYQRQLSQAQEQYNASKAEMIKAKQAASEFAEAVAVAEANVSRVAEEVTRARQYVHNKEQQLEKLKNAQGNRVAIFGGPAMVELVRRIDLHKREFHNAPLGPIGSLLSLDSKDMALAVQYAIGQLFRNFIVSDRHDEMVFKRIMHSLNNRALTNTVQCYNYSFDRPPYSDVRHLALPEGVQTVLDVLKITKIPKWHIVQNILIDYGNIEAVGLCKQESMAFSAIRGHAGRQLSCVFLPDGRKVYKKGNMEATVHSGLSLTATLGKDMSESIQELQQHRMDAIAELQALEDEKCGLLRELQKAREQKDRAFQTSTQVENSTFHLESQVDMLTTTGPAVENTGEGAVAEMSMAINDLDDSIRQKKREVEASQIELEDASKRLEEVKLEYKRSHNEAASVAEEVQKMEDSMYEAATAVTAAERDLKELEMLAQEKQAEAQEKENEKAAVEVKIKDVQQESRKLGLDSEVIEASRSAVMEWLQATASQGVHIDDFFTSDNLELEIKKQERLKRKKEAMGGGNLHELKDAKEAKEAKLSHAERLHKNICKVVCKTEEGLKKRDDIYENMTFNVDEAIGMVFEEMMDMRGNHGRLNIDHGRAVIEPK